MVPLEQRLREEDVVLVHGKGRDSDMLCDVDDEDAGMRWRRLLAREIPFMPMRRDTGAERCMRVVSIHGRACNRFPPGERLDGRSANRLIDAHKDEKVDNGMNLNPYRMLIKRKRQICEQNQEFQFCLYVLIRILVNKRHQFWYQILSDVHCCWVTLKDEMNW